MFRDTLFPAYAGAVGVVLQSYLRRTAQDVEAMIAVGARVRLCKGAYQEPATVAFPAKADVDANYVACIERLLVAGRYPGLATHDERIIAHAKAFARKNGIEPARFEFQMLYGVRPQLQLDLLRRGFGVLVATPFGPDWYRYLMRRLAERPANTFFFLKNLVRS
jgi:proline dehydrogenase